MLTKIFLGLHLVHQPCLSRDISGGTLSQGDPPEKLIGIRHFWESLHVGPSSCKEVIKISEAQGKCSYEGARLFHF